MKKALYNKNLFMIENDEVAHHDYITNSKDIIDNAIYSQAIYNNFRYLSLKNDLTSDYSVPYFSTIMLN